MELPERLLEILRALYWNLGSDLNQAIAINWLEYHSTQGKLQSGRSAKGKLLSINVTKKSLQDLVNLGLIDVELRGGSSLPGVFMYAHTVVRLLPKALEVNGIKESINPTFTDNDRYAPITLDSYEFSQMIKAHFSTDEQAELCFQLGLDYESVVPAKVTKGESARAIVEYMRHNARLADLWRAAQEKRPRSDWSALLGN